LPLIREQGSAFNFRTVRQEAQQKAPGSITARSASGALAHALRGLPIPIFARPPRFLTASLPVECPGMRANVSGLLALYLGYPAFRCKSFQPCNHVVGNLDFGCVGAHLLQTGGQAQPLEKSCGLAKNGPALLRG